jgi:hypothetical protein
MDGHHGREKRRLLQSRRFLLRGRGRGYSRAMSQEQQDAAQKDEQEVEETKQTMSELEEGDPPQDLAEWPGGKAKYQTHGGPEGEEGYDEAATRKLGPSSLRHHEDGSVTIEGEQVDDPEKYKGEPIPGGPSDPDAPPDPAMVGEDEDEDEINRA